MEPRNRNVVIVVVAIVVLLCLCLAVAAALMLGSFFVTDVRTSGPGVSAGAEENPPLPCNPVRL